MLSFKKGEGTRILLSKARLGETPVGASRGGSATARGKRVPGVKSTFGSYKPKRRQMGVGKRTFHQKKFPNHLPQNNTFNSIGRFVLNLRTELIGVKGKRLLRGKRV
ncbi:hypothetical protein AM233_10515 [Bacillus sp. FJAT-22058]|nr:hypothetical protein AM233_10515 [Bacillus sp. FJAT-22058]